ncbi:hypothetical protein ACJO2E_12920 [Marinobacter sp. M1N3S26]|uniref:hypothetical protein n=1 Tax=Marinobacter sp. M1N3S26 TaxID=3382299 RepID=UPI00387AEF16
MYEEYENLLDRNYSPDLWSDEGIGLAVSLLNEFSVADWDALSVSVSKKDVSWKTKCAETLSEANPEYATPILKDMMLTQNNIALEAVVDSLNSFNQDGLNLQLNEHEKDILLRLSKSSGLASLIAKNLLKIS